MAERKHSLKPEWQKKIAEERIGILFREAESMANRGKMDFANRYVEMARKIGMRYNVKMPADLRGKYCRNCHVYFVPGKNCSVEKQAEKNSLRVKCFNCDKIIHISPRRLE